MYVVLEYEDERLKEHAEELLKDLNNTLGPSTGDEDEQWEETDGEQDEEGDGDSDAEMEGT